MPGHKGRGPLGVEKYDITEISGADVLYSPSGIILESELYATELFGTAHTFYSAEGSTLSIKAMLAIALRELGYGKRPVILAGRNAHKAFIYGAAQLGLEVKWLMPDGGSHIASLSVSAEGLRKKLLSMGELPFAVYITSPDYLGGSSDIAALSSVCREFGIPLLVDNAHGAYLAFLDESKHPISLGAAMCCDSAHKTLPVLTGGSYLHISKEYSFLTEGARDMLSLFSSTSPSYLILASLDLVNKYISEGYRQRLRSTVDSINGLKKELAGIGFAPEISDPLKIVIKASKYGYSGYELAEKMRNFGLECEMADRDYLVMMLTPENDPQELSKIAKAISGLEIRQSIEIDLPGISEPCIAMSIRDSIFSSSESIPVCDAVGRILSQPSVSCPPAVPVAICGERLTRASVELLSYYGISRISVVKEDKAEEK